MSAKRKSAPKAIVQQPVAQSYARFLAGIKERIRTAQVRAALAANAELVLHYWEIGSDILANQARQGWGAKVIDRLAADLQRDFPKLSGYSVRNLKYMRAFAESWPDRPIVHQLAAQIPWGHNCVLLDRVRDAGTRAFYIRQTIQHGWPKAARAGLALKLTSSSSTANRQLKNRGQTSSGSTIFRPRAYGATRGTNKHFTLKENPLKRSDLDDFVSCYNPKNSDKSRAGRQKQKSARVSVLYLRELIANFDHAFC